MCEEVQERIKWVGGGVRDRGCEVDLEADGF